MIFINIMILIVAIALKSLSPVLLTRISAIVSICIGVISYLLWNGGGNTLYIQSIGLDTGTYSGLFHAALKANLNIAALTLYQTKKLDKSRYVALVANKHFIHTSLVLNSNVTRNTSQPDLIDQFLRNEGTDINKALIKFINNDEGNTESSSQHVISMSNYGEVFPWLLDRNGKIIDLNKNVGLFDAVAVVSLYLRHKYGVNKEEMCNVKLNELIKPDIEGNKGVNILELYIKVSKAFNKDKEALMEKILKSDVTSNEEIKRDVITGIVKSSKPLGEYEEISLNDIVDKLNLLQWEVILNRAEITTNTLPLGMNLLGFWLVLKSYVRFVHNRPYDPNLSDIHRSIERSLRDKQLVLFVFAGAPLVLLSLKAVPLKFRDIESFPSCRTDLKGQSIDSLCNNRNINNKNFLPSCRSVRLSIPYGEDRTGRVITSLNSKIGKWIKFLLGYIFINLFVLNLLGLNVLSLLNNFYYLKLHFYVSVMIAFLYQICQLYILHLFLGKRLKISKVLPDFIINWLKMIEIFSENKESIKSFKDICYREIIVYFVLVFIVSMLF